MKRRKYPTVRSAWPSAGTSGPNQDAVGFLELGEFSLHSFHLVVVVVGFKWRFLTWTPGNPAMVERTPISAKVGESEDDVLREKLAELIG